MSADSRALPTPKAGDRYSKPTTHYHTDIDKIPATFCDNLQSLLAIAG
jgi:hypothetical protein